MAENKAKPTKVSVPQFLKAVEPDACRADALVLDRLFREVTGFRPVMWGPSIIGYGRYHYRYASGREGDACATGFSPRKANLVLYILPGYSDFGTILQDLGKHKKGKSCLYLNRLADVDMGALKRLIRAGPDDLGKCWPVTPL